jgi:integrase
MADAIVMLPVNTGLRADEVVTLTWQRVNLQVRSGWIDVVGNLDKRLRMRLRASTVEHDAGVARHRRLLQRGGHRQVKADGMDLQRQRDQLARPGELRLGL